MNFTELKEDYERAIEVVNDTSQPMFQRRAEELVRELAEDFPIEEILFGMGSFSLHGPKVPIKYEDESVGLISLNDFFSWSEKPSDYRHKVIGFNERHKEIMDELREMFDAAATNFEVPPLFDIKP